jgi:hypothetical protein
MSNTTNTGGGAGIGGGVGTGGGDFSGRDRLTFNTTTEGIQNLLYMMARMENKLDLYVYRLDKQVDSHDALEQRVNNLSNRTTVSIILGTLGTLGLAMQLWK